jgi:hypothetical protein
VKKRKEINMDPVAQLATVALLATLVELLVEYFLKPLLPPEQPEPAPCEVPLRSRWWSAIPWPRYVAALAAIGLALAYQVDVLSMTIAGLSPSLLGMVLTGLIISRGSNYVHDWIGRTS